jgi:shikimate dehydrogenase
MQHLYIVGHPVGHSKSPVMYNKLFHDLGLTWSYDFKDIDTSAQADVFLQSKDYLAVNVTTPYKPNAYQCAQTRAASAKIAAGVNMLVNRSGVLVGFETDGTGCIRDLERIYGPVAGADIVICGTGPTSRAIAYAAALAGAERVSLIGRSVDRSRSILQQLADTWRDLAYTSVDLPASSSGQLSFKEAYEAVTFRCGGYATSAQALHNADIIIDATPLGMKANDPAPFDTSVLRSDQLVYDVVYGHGETALIAAAQACGCHAMTGQGMLVAQAVENATMLLNVEGVSNVPSWDEMFALMADAAGFAC